MALLKDLAPFFCNTNKKVAIKALEFKNSRQRRCRNFIHDSKCADDKQDSTLYEEIAKVRNSIAEIIHSLGLVTKSELHVIKDEINSLLKKINREQ